MPMPVSVTEIETFLPSTSTSSVTLPPSGVYFSALPIRLCRASVILSRSPRMTGSFGGSRGAGHVPDRPQHVVDVQVAVDAGAQQVLLAGAEEDRGRAVGIGHGVVLADQHQPVAHRVAGGGQVAARLAVVAGHFLGAFGDIL